jgi:hypothetical protein
MTEKEKEILTDMIELSNIYYALIDNNISNINNKIIELNNRGNNFFTNYPDLLEEYYMLFGDFLNKECNDKKIDELTKFIDNLELLKKNICNHEYIYDLIDIDPDKSQTIQYCKKCNKIKK